MKREKGQDYNPLHTKGFLPSPNSLEPVKTLGYMAKDT